MKRKNEETMYIIKKKKLNDEKLPILNDTEIKLSKLNDTKIKLNNTIINKEIKETHLLSKIIEFYFGLS